jgi:hypothetical protein
MFGGYQSVFQTLSLFFRVFRVYFVDCVYRGLYAYAIRSQGVCWRLQGSAYIELEERSTAFGGRELLFQMLEGEFERFEVRGCMHNTHRI